MEKLELLGFYNKWWLTGKIPRELYQDFKRGIFSILEGGLPYASVSNRIISLIGLRRTGKTTILYQLIQSLLNKIDPKRVLFLNISDPLIANNSQFLEDLLKEYQKTILQENFSQLTEPVYIFFDEIQYLPGWELFLKRYIDLKFKIKFIITGSASLKIVKKSKESLVGRLDEQRLHPLSFREFIEFKYHKLQTKEKNLIIHFIYRNAADNNLDLLRKYHSYSSLAKKIFQKKTEIFGWQDAFQTLLNEYIEKGGFPEIIQLKSQELAYRYLNQDVLERILAQDIPQIARIRDPQLLQSLLVYCAQKNGFVLSYESLSKDTGARIETIKNYFLYLASSFLIAPLAKFKKSAVSRFTSRQKIYLADLGLRNSILKLEKNTIFSSQYKGINAETLVANNLFCKNWFNLAYWRKDDYEVDFVINYLGIIIPLEVKYRDKIEKGDLKGLGRFIKNYKTNGGIVVTESRLDFQDDILFVPLWLFMLIV